MSDNFVKKGDLYVLNNSVADKVEAEKPLVGWYSYEVQGCEIKRLSDWESLKYKDPGQCPNIELEQGLHLDDEILVVHLIGGWVKAKVTRIDLLKGEAQAEDVGNVYPLVFGKDERRCWVCTMALNKNAINKIELRDTP